MNNVDVEKLVEETTQTEYLLKKEITIKYNFEKCKENLLKVVNAFIEAKYTMNLNIYDSNMSGCKFDDIPKSDAIHSRYSSIDQGVAMVLDSEKDAIQLNDDLNFVRTKLTSEELVYWNIVIMGRASRASAENLLGLSKKGIKPIERSCIIKACMLIGISVLVKQSSSVKSFNKRITEIVNET